MKKIDSSTKSRTWQAHEQCPFGSCHCASVKSKQSIASGVASLLGRCSPSTVSRFIVSCRVVGESIERHSFWAWPHVAQKTFEAVSPLPAHRDAATAVLFKILGVWIQAASLCRFPRSIFPARVFAPRVAVGKTVRPSELTFQTAATKRCADTKFLAESNFDRSAFASAAPSRLSSFSVWQDGWNKFKHGPATKGFSGKVNKIMAVHAVESIGWHRAMSTFRGING